jgi:hypothetical protein
MPESKESSAPKEIRTAKDPSVTPIKKSKNVILDIIFLPTSLLRIKSATYAQTLRRTTHSILWNMLLASILFGYAPILPKPATTIHTAAAGKAMAAFRIKRVRLKHEGDLKKR